jgi:uncharacterized Zn finger protein (UPF0148 family)
VSVTALRYMTCEWCGRPAGGELLCTICERQQIWAIKDHANSETDTSKSASTPPTHRGVLQESTTTPRISVRRAVAALGVKRGGRRRPVDCLPGVRERHPALDRIVAWPEAI